LTLDDVTNGAVAAIATYPKIGAFLDERRIRESTEANWPDAPAPLVFWLWMSQSDLLGRIATEPLVRGLEGALRAFEDGRWVKGDWRSRIVKLLPPKSASGFDHYLNFRSALFELNLALRLVCNSVVEVQPDGPERGCDLLVRDSNQPIVEVEAYAPAKGVREMYQQQLVDQWDALVSGKAIEMFDSASTPEDISLSPNAIVDALDDYFKLGNFALKRQQLAAARNPSLIAIRAFGLTANLAEIATTPGAREFAARMDPAVWGELPDSCLGFLFSLQGDAPSPASPMATVFAPGRRPDERVTAYLQRCGALHK